MNLFEYSMERFKFGKNINIVECFSGIGTQAMAWKRLAKKYDLKLNFMAISEIDKYAIKSYEAIHGQTLNLGAIGTFDRFPKDIDICSWSFPCQDISLAGKQEGMVDGSRSNYGYVFLDTVENTPYNERPKVLLMENVPALVSAKFQEDYKEIHYRLERMGYTSWGGLLNAKDYRIPQNRERIFIVSILGEYAYTFPKAFPLSLKLEDVLEKSVDEKYYLSQEMIDGMQKTNFAQYKLENRLQDKEGIANTILAEAVVFIPEKTKQGYAIAEVGDGVYLDRPHQKRGVVQKGMTPTIKTQGKDIGVVVLDGEVVRVRKLTPKETWRLMGVNDEDFDKAKAAGLSDAQLYKQAGNAIVVDVLEKIFENLI